MIKMLKRSSKKYLRPIKYSPMKKRENCMIRQEWLKEWTISKMPTNFLETSIQKSANRILTIMRQNIDIVRKKNKILLIFTISMSLQYIFRNKGNMKKLLETIILSKNEDIPRFIEFYDKQIEQGILTEYKAYETSKNKIKTLREDPEAQKIDMDSLTRQIRQRP